MFSNSRGSVDKTGQTAVDPYFKDTILLIHADGTSGTGNITHADSSSYATPITRGNGVNAQGSFNPYSSNWSMYFNGTTDYVSVPNINLNGTWQIEGWFHINAFTNPTIFWGSDNGAGANPKIGLYITGTNLSVDVNGTIQISIPYANWLTAYTWYHIAVMNYATATQSIRVFVNGIFAGSNGSYAAPGLSGLTAAFNIAYLGETFGFYTGFVSNFRVSGIYYYMSFAPPISNLANTYAYILICQASTIVDSSTNAYALTNTGSVTSANTNIPFSGTYSWAFSGSNYITTTNSVNFYFSNTDYIIEVFVYPTVAWASQCILAGPTNAPFIKCDGSGNLYFGFNGANQVKFAFNPVLNVWSHIVCERRSNTINLYINGQYANSSSLSDSSTLNISGVWTFGADIGGTSKFTGNMSNLRITSGAYLEYYNSFPSNSAISALLPTGPFTSASVIDYLLFSNQSWQDLSSSNKIPTVTGTPWILPYSPFASSDTYSPNAHGGSLYSSLAADYVGSSTTTMAGSFDHLTLGNNDFTIEFWAYPLANTSAAQYFFGNYSADLNQKGLRIGVINTTGLQVLNNAGATAINYQISTRGVYMNSWTHVAVTRRNGILRGYINGVLYATNADTYTYNVPTFTIGSQVVARTTLLLGYTCDVRIARGISLYNANFTPPVNMITSDTTPAGRNYYAATMVTNTSQYLYWEPTTVLDTSVKFCIEFWINFSAAPAGVAPIIGDWSNLNGLQLKISQTTMSLLYASVYTITTPALYNFQLNTWYHIAIIGDTNTFIAVNGVVYDTGFKGGSGASAAVSNGYWGGLVRQFGGGTATSGYSFSARDFRITTGSAVYSTSGFTPPTAPLTNSVPAGGTVLALAFAGVNNNNLQDGAIGGLANLGSFTFSQIGSLLSSPYKDTANTVLMMNFNRAGVYDATGKNVLAVGVTATVPPTVSTAQSKFGGSSVGPFVNTFYRIPNSPLWDFGNAGFAFEFWVYPTSITTLQTIFSKKAATTGFGPVQIDITAAGKIQVLLSTSGTATTQTATGTTTLTNNAWNFVRVHQYILSNLVSQVYISVNGNSDVTINKLTATNLILNTADVAIGNNSIASSSQPFTGYLDDFRVTRGHGANGNVRGYSAAPYTVQPTTAFPNQ